MRLVHNPRSFLTGDDPFLTVEETESTDNGYIGQLTFESRHEGFLNIPHGGLAMGLCFDAWRRSGGYRYPVESRFKWGGTGLLVGDPASFSVESVDGIESQAIKASITKTGDRKPYIQCSIGPTERSETDGMLNDPPYPEFRPLPYYRNCFVCGHHRSVVGLQRRFYARQTDGSLMTTVEWGSRDDDIDRASSFLIDEEELHPAVLTSMFDENSGWAGFLVTKTAGLSVRMSLTILRPIARTEHLMLISKPSGTRGNPRAPRFFSSEGRIVSLSDSASPELVAYGTGEWVILNQYTQQIKDNLLPRDDWQWIFE
jgi:hypothetical protein